MLVKTWTYIAISSGKICEMRQNAAGIVLSLTAEIGGGNPGSTVSGLSESGTHSKGIVAGSCWSHDSFCCGRDV